MWFFIVADEVEELKIKFRKLAGELHKWREEVHAQMPVPNPDYTTKD